MGLVGTRRWLSSYRQPLVGGVDLWQCNGSRVHLSPRVPHGGQALSHVFRLAAQLQCGGGWNEETLQVLVVIGRCGDRPPSRPLSAT